MLGLNCKRTGLMIRTATSDDTQVIAAIMGAFVRSSTVSFSAIEKSAADWCVILQARRAAGREFWVACEEGKVIGFATYDQFRPNDGYRHTMEHTIYVDPAALGRGTGRALLQLVEDHARAGDAHAMIGVMDAENAASIAFHLRMGYEEQARLCRIGRKFDRWLDAVMLVKYL
jgi:L-amino acid N-acyltransferase